MLIEKYQDVLREYCNNYFKILRIMYPSKNSTGFTERNLSVNFANAYQQQYKNAIAWYEYQFGERNNLHYDCILVNPDEKEILIIESKRFNNLNKKIREVYRDIKRINEITTVYSAELKGRIPDYSITGVVLADVWTGKNKSKGKIKQSFFDKVFLKQYQDISNSDLNIDDFHAEYFVEDIINKKIMNKEEFKIETDKMEEDYSLLGIFWKVK